MNTDVKTLVQRIADDPSLRETLWEALVSDTRLLRMLVEQINEGIEGGHIALAASVPRRPDPKSRPKREPTNGEINANKAHQIFKEHARWAGAQPQEEPEDPDYI